MEKTKTKSKLQPKPEMKVDVTAKTSEPAISVSGDVVETAPAPTATPPNVVHKNFNDLLSE